MGQKTAVTAAERRIAPPLATLIGKKPGVCGGDACVLGTRIPVWGLESARRKGLSDAQIMRAYPALKRKHLKAAWDYVALHLAEIERQIAENEA